jgi:hypothetical protein
MAGKQSRSVKSAGEKGRTRKQLKDHLLTTFERGFPSSVVDVSDGYKDGIHIMVVSKAFEKMSANKQQNAMWTVLEDAGLTEDERTLITLLYPVSPADIR